MSLRYEGIGEIIGKRIKAIIVNEGIPPQPNDQVFLVFSDNTYYEIWGELSSTRTTSEGGLEIALKYACQFPVANRKIIANKKWIRKY